MSLNRRIHRWDIQMSPRGCLFAALAFVAIVVFVALVP